MAEPSSSRSPALSFALVVGAIVVVVAVVLVVVRAGDGSRAAAVPAGPPMANIDIVSDPVGASVFLADGGLLGIAPLVLTRPQSDTPLAIVVKHEGYNDRHSTVPLMSPSGRIDVALTVIGGKDPVVKAPPDGFVP